MRLLILCLLFPFAASAQILFPSLDTIRTEPIPGSGSIRALLYLQKDWGSVPYDSRRLVWYLGGDGEKFSTIADTVKMRNTGLLKELISGSAKPTYGHIYVTFQRSGNFFVESDFDNAYTYIRDKYGININQVYCTAHSSGFTSMIGWMNYKDTMFAAMAGSAGGVGGYGSFTFNRTKIKKNWLWGVWSMTDALQPFFGNGGAIFDSSIVGQGLSPKMVKMDVYMTNSHSQNYDSIFKRWGKVERWLDMHHRVLDTTAKRYVDSLERGFDYNFSEQCKYIVASLSAGAFKEGLLARIQAARDLKFGVGHKIIIVNMANAAKTHPLYKTMSSNTTGASVTALPDYRTGTNTGIGFTILHNGGSNAKRTQYNSDHYGLPDSTMGESFEVYALTPKRFRFTSVPPGYYSVAIYGTSVTVPGAEPGWTATLQGATRRMNQQNRNTHQYGLWENVQPQTDTIGFSMTGLSSTGGGQIAAVMLIQYGTFGASNTPPFADAGPDQTKTLPTTTATLAGTATDLDGAITGVLWTKKSGSPAGGNITSPTSLTSGITALQAGTYTYQLQVTDDDGAINTDEMTITVNEVLGLYNAPDTIVWKAQGSAQPGVTLAAVDSSGVSVSWVWTRLSGAGSATITNGTTATPTITNLVGEYNNFKVVATSASGATDADTINIWMRDAMNRGRDYPCRVGTKQVFKVGQTTGGGINATSFSMQYVKRDNLIPGLQGGDTIMLVRNPNNNGIWNRVTFGDIQAPVGCPIVIVPDSSGTGIVTISDTAVANTSAFYIASHDTNDVKNLIIDGTANYARKGVVYGFKIGNPTTGNDKYFYRAMAGNYLNNLTIRGVAMFNCSTGFSLKTISASDKPFKLYDNFRNTIYIEDCYADSSVNEVAYIGTTDRVGAGQGNDGPPTKGNYISFNRMIVRGTGWDGLQTSYYGGASIKNCVVLRTGNLNQGGQIFSAFHGGSVGPAIMDSNFFRWQVGGPGFLGEGKSSFRNNIVWDYQQMYNSQARDAGVTTYSALQIFNEQNYYIGQTGSSYGVVVANSGGETFLPGSFRYNTILTDKTIGNFFSTAYSDTIAGNVIKPAATSPTAVLDTSRLKDMPSYLMYKYMMANPSKRDPSFYDIFAPVPPDPNIPPTANAGTDVSSSATTVQLFGSASDPDGTYTVAWTQTSGTATTITNGTTLSPTLTGLTVGVRVFRLRVTDNDGATTDDLVTVTTTVNQPPTVSVTADAVITYPSQITLVATASDPEGSALTYAWTVTAASPVTPSIASPTAASTDILGMVAGSYTFQVVVSDGVNDVTRTINVTVVPPPAPRPKVRIHSRIKVKTP